MVDPTLGGRIDYHEVYENVDFESLFEGTQFEGGEDGVLSVVGGEIGENLGRILGAIVGYVVGMVVLGTSLFGGGDAEEAAGESGDGQTDGTGSESGEVDA